MGYVTSTGFFSILSSFFQLMFITTRETVYGHYKNYIYIIFFYNKILYYVT